MDNEWISLTAESDELVRVAELDDFEDGVASFTIYDMRLKPIEEFSQTIIAEAFRQAEEIPDQYKPMMIFHVVSPENGEFVVFGYDQFAGTLICSSQSLESSRTTCQC